MVALHSEPAHAVEKNGTDAHVAHWNKRERTGLLRVFDWFIRPWHYFDTIPRGVAYLIAASGFYGGALFVIGSFAGCSPAVSGLVNCVSGLMHLLTAQLWSLLDFEVSR